ncbi:hypothetical protein AcW1_004943 [Taiwanofungus camphoratus]|nr:hypothetical protein AcW2_006046 [Antrodia cinnamomea]KAI0940138.1 hypothetical protein AcV5_001327 [Antrodia cinnamomea]KAI0941312.1 hypothetical protein AcV7_002917 [Antrodia cinnamomea]KAI0960424.1 hypothetical protein AcW1_004943 [Antrodia cinnamomea]
MLKRAWRPIVGTAVLVGTPTYLYYRYSFKSQPETFDLPVRLRDSNGKRTMSTRSIPLLSKEQVDARLNEHAVFTSTTRPNGIIWKQSTAYLSSNDPIEDANSSAIVERDPSDPASPGDLLFFAVMDGHGGFHTSRLLSKVLIPAVAFELYSLTKNPDLVASKSITAEKLKSWLYPSASTAAIPVPFDVDPGRVSRAIQAAFVNLDMELINAPLRVLAEYLNKSGVEKGTIPDLSQHPMALASMEPAITGSCAIMALLDTAHQNLYIACTGDSRAVAGVYEESEDGQGTWRVEVLSEDQTGRNPKELRRVQSEHPPDEADDVVIRGRILGGLEPSRAFGDARYKWPREVQATLSKAFLEGNGQSMRSASSLLKTPPYVISRPEVTHRKLSLPPFSDASTKPKSTMRFLVLATDGLWDELSSEEVVALVGGHLAGLKGAIPKSSLSNLVRTSSGSRTVEGKIERRGSEKGTWAFVDDNISTHLIRNAFGGADEGRLRQLLSIPAPYSRSYRDDITVTVVWWEDGRENDARAATTAAEQVKARL